MAERIDWLPDGTPYSPRFGDRYRSEAGRSLAQSREVFLAGCGLPAAWAGATRWCILETGFGLGLNFLVAWQAWRADPARPAQLHYVATEAWPAGADDLRRGALSEPDFGELAPLAEQLADRWWGLLPGHHRMDFEGGQVQLTLLVGDSQKMLREAPFTADSVFLDGFSPAANPAMWNADAMQAVARHARPGTRAATWTIARGVRDALSAAGFEVQKVPGVPPKRDNLQARYAPQWTPRPPRANPALARFAVAVPGRCVVVGAGITGAAVARSLALRGWRVTVLDAGPAPATAGASSLPAGLFAPHVSPDDAVLSRLSRAGVRRVLETGAALRLKPEEDWGPEGVMEHRVGAETPGLPRRAVAEGAEAAAPDANDTFADWSRQADAGQLAAAALPADTVALWHSSAGWLRPARLVVALLATPGITVRTGAAVARVEAGGPGCRLLDVDGTLLDEAALVVVACGAGSPALVQGLALQPVAGQVSLGTATNPAFPPFPVNGHGSFLSAIPLADGQRHWLAGATFERGALSPEAPAERVATGHAENRERLHTLLPAAAAALDRAGPVQAWRGVRGAAPDRLPVVGPWPLEATAERQAPAADSLPPLWLCTGMGSRGLTLALLCGELLAARIHGEPLPLDRRLAEAVAAERLARLPTT